jgi:transcriptional regulator with XRE-family HTH domain
MAEKENKSLGPRIRRYREQAGLSQSDLGDKLGVSYQQIQKYERGMNRLSVDTLLKVAKALDLPLNAFVDTGEGHAKGGILSEPRPDYGFLSKEERDLVKGFRELSDDKLRAAFLALLRASGKKH